MRKTLVGLGALSVAALMFSSCDKQQQTGVDPVVDMAVGGTTDPDLSTSTGGDLSTNPADLASNPPGPATEFVVLRIGTGAKMLNNDATAGFLERRKISDGTLVGTPLALPTAVNGANKQLTFSGGATVEGQLSLSADGKYLLVAGYAADPNVPNVSSSLAATYNRVIGRIDAQNNINTTTAFVFATGMAVRGATSVDGNGLWVSSEGGIGYTTLGNTMPPTVLSAVNSRAIEVFGGSTARQLYVSSVASAGLASNMGINTVGTGTPTTAAVTVTRLPGFTDTNSPAAVGFVAFDRDNNGMLDQMYVADDRVGGGGGVQRWKLNGTSWMLEGTISTGANTGARYVAGVVSNTTVTLFATTAESGTTQARLLRLTDAGGTTGAVTSMVISTAPTNTTYRGVALAPQ